MSSAHCSSTLAGARPTCPRRLSPSLAAAPAALADIHIGVILSTTGPAASLGIPEEQTMKLWPGEMAGEKVRFTILNDASDTTTPTKNAERLINEDKVDLIIGASVTPTSLAVVETAGAAQVPVISLAGGGAIVAAAGRAAQVGVQALADRADLDRAGARPHAEERQGQVDGDDRHRQRATAKASSRRSSAVAPAQRLQGRRQRALQPDRPERHRAGAEDHRRQSGRGLHLRCGHARRAAADRAGERGYKGLVYQTQGVANNDFLRVGGK